MSHPEKPRTRLASTEDSETLKNLFKEVRAFREESKDMGKAIDSIQEGLGELRVWIGEQRTDINKCMNDIDELKCENVNLKREIDKVKQELNEVQQYSRRNTVDIQGVPETKSENVFEVVKKVAKVLRFELRPDMVDAVHRLSGGGNTSRPRGIILKLVCRGDCDELLRLAKVKRGFSASELGVTSEEKIYVNPSLSKVNRELMYLAKSAVRESHVKFAWYSNGKVLVRKKDGQPAIHITSRHQLQDLQRRESSVQEQ